MILAGITIVVILALLKAIADSIVHHDSFKKLGFGKFFWRETVYAQKKSIFHKYFPMFYDMWHLAEALIVFEVSVVGAWFIGNILIWSLPLYIFGSVVFLILYEGVDK